MPEEIAVRQSVGSRTEAEDRPAHRILTGGMKREGSFWISPECRVDSGNWNVLAGDNEIHAAISTFNEAKEELKSRENIEFILSHTVPDTRILDLGCGYGRLAKYLLPVRTFETYIGLDCSPVMLRKFHERYASSEQERATPLILVRGDIDRIPLQDGSIDACIVSAVYLHNHKDITRKSIAEIRRVLKPGGRLLVLSSFPNARSLAAAQGWAFLAYLTAIGQERKNGPVRYFHLQEIRDLLADFSETTIYPFGFSVLPKTILGMPLSLARPYHRLHRHVHAFLRRHLPHGMRAAFCSHYDVVARA